MGTGSLSVFRNIVIVLVIFSIAPSLSQFIGWQFLPSTDWLASSLGAAKIASVCAGFAGMVLTFFITLHDGFFWRAFYLLVAPFIFAFLGYSAVTQSVPMAAALAMGEEVSLTFTVKRPDEPGDRRCRDQITIADVPFLLDTVCDVPTMLRRGLRKGDPFQVHGRGTEWGVFAEQISRW